jgi:hypothetical protein
MDSSWLAVLFPALIAVVVIFAPGYLLARSAGAGRVLAIGTGPLLSLSLTTVAALGLSYVHIPWTWWSFSIVTAAAAAATFALRRLLTPRAEACPAKDDATATPALWLTLATLIPACIITVQLVLVFRSPDLISQTTDGVFHLNAVKYMLDSANASVFAPSIGLNGAPSVYPASWHSIVAMVAGTSGATIPQSVTAVNLVIGALVWPTGVIFFLRQLIGNNAFGLISGGVLSSCFGIFPFRLLDWGVLYPSFLSVATTLPAVALIMLYFKRSNSGDSLRTPAAVWLMLWCVPGVFLTQPSGMLMLLAICLPLILSAENRLFDAPLAISRARRIPAWFPQSRWPVNILLVGCAVLLWVLLRPLPLTETRFTVPTETPAQALGELVWAAPLRSLPSFAVAILIAIGFLTIIRNKQRRWFGLSHMIVSLLFFAAAGLPTGFLRTFLTGSWYDDYNRVAASLVLTWVPLGAVGASKVLEVIAAAAARRFQPVQAGRLTAAGAVGILVVTFVSSQALSTAAGIQSAAANFNIDQNARMMSSDEQALFKRLPELVPAEAAVAGDPWNGSALAYFESGTKMVFSHMFVPMTPDRDLVARHLNEISYNPAVCDAARRLNVRYVLTSYQPVFDFGYPRDGQYDGLRYIPLSDGFSKVASVGIASLYKVDACW